MNRIYKNLIMSFAIILCVTFGAFAQDDKDKKPKDDGPKVVVRPKQDDKPKDNPPPKDNNKDKPKKPSTILNDVRKTDFLTGILKTIIG
jgi:hypothetical protein